jgi:hypothetical protein
MLPQSRRRRTTMVELPAPVCNEAIPPDVRRFIQVADERILSFQQSAHIPGFVPSDAERVYRILSGIAGASMAAGPRFCEWGSGFGVVAGLAAMLDFEAWGIEIESELVEESRQLAADFELNAEFVHGSFIPRGGEDIVDKSDAFSWLVPHAGNAYEEMGLDLDDFDVVFAYPWPDEDRMTVDLFHRFASAGAILVTFRGGDDICIRRKMLDSSRRRVR